MSLRDKKYSYVYLKPGELYLGEMPAIVSTVLGSCVSVTMFHPVTRLGAICHGFLPHCSPVSACDEYCREIPKYVVCAIRMMLRRFDSSGVRRNEIEVKLFGGASMFRSAKNSNSLSVGQENLLAARRTIEEEALKVSVSDTGGFRGRKLLFISDTGEVFLRRVHSFSERGLP